MAIARISRGRKYGLGRRVALKVMVLGVVGLMSLAGTNPAMAATNQDNGSFWTQFTPSADTRLIFVSSSEGDDSNNGLTPATPVKTLMRAEGLLRNGFPDWMLLKRGDVWETGLGSWSKSGRSESELMVVGAYGNGESRPRLSTGVGRMGLEAYGNGLVQHVAFVGIHLEPANRADDDFPAGIRWRRRADNILFEDLFIKGFKDNVELQSLSDTAPITNFRINGCVITGAWSRSSHAQGIYVHRLDGLTIENSVVASNGFNLDRGANPTIFNHNIYIQNGTQGVVLRNSIVADASSHGVQMRPGGLVDDNLFIYNPLSIHLGGGDHPEDGGATGSVQRNVVLHGRGISSILPRSIGIEASNIRQALIKDNIISVAEIGHNGLPIGTANNGSYGITDLVISSNVILNWHGAIGVRQPAQGQIFDRVVVERNRIFADLLNNAGNSNFNKPMTSIFVASHPGLTLRENSYYHYGMHSRPFMIGSTRFSVERWQAEVESDMKIEELSASPAKLEIDDYLASLGLVGSVEEFLAKCKEMSRFSFDSRFTSAAVRAWALDNIPR